MLIFIVHTKCLQYGPSMKRETHMRFCYMLFYIIKLQQKLESSLKSWVMQVCEDNPFGAVLVSNQILPLLGLKGTCTCILISALTVKFNPFYI